MLNGEICLIDQLRGDKDLFRRDDFKGESKMKKKE